MNVVLVVIRPAGVKSTTLDYLDGMMFSVPPTAENASTHF